MPKNNKVTKEEEVKVSPEEKVEEKTEVVAEKKSTGIEYPEGDAKGKFHSVSFQNGYVVYNPSGQRVTGIIDKIAAADIVRQQNQAAQIKG